MRCAYAWRSMAVEALAGVILTHKESFLGVTIHIPLKRKFGPQSLQNTGPYALLAGRALSSRPIMASPALLHSPLVLVQPIDPINRPT